MDLNPKPIRYLTFFLLAITMSFMSCEAPAKKDKKNAEEETSTSSSSGSSYGVSYPAPIQEYADNYCSCYADAAKKAAEMIELRTDHEEKLSSGDLSCDEKDILEEEIGTMWRAMEDIRRDAESKFAEWYSQAFQTKGEIILYGKFLAQEKTCPQVFFNLEAGRDVPTNYRYYDCDRYSGGSDDVSPAATPAPAGGSSDSEGSISTSPHSEARQSGKIQTVIGELSPNHAVLTTEEHIEFYLTDNNSETVQVMYLGSMPNDLINSEKVTVTGSFINDSLFKASKILTKPRKNTPLWK